MRFTGNIDAKVDDKGRVFVPSSFRKILQREDSAGLVLRRDVFQRCLVLYPAEVWNRQVDALAARTSMFDRQGRDALRRFVAGYESGQQWPSADSPQISGRGWHIVGSSLHRSG